jgi:hypothetical protein
MNNITEILDRFAIRDLVDRYAHCADRRDANGQLALFTKDTHFVVYMDAKSDVPAMDFHRSEDLIPVFADLNQYDATTHFMGQNTVQFTGEGRATGETYCIAHHVKPTTDNKKVLFVASIRYEDQFVKEEGKWLFSERKLFVDWMENRPL